MEDSTDRASWAPPPPRRRLSCAVVFAVLLALWLAMIVVASSDWLSEAHTDIWLERLLRFFSSDTVGSASSSDALSVLSFIVRKLAHLLVYAVLGLLAAQTLALCGRARGTDRKALLRMAAIVLPFGILVAALDEWHQTHVPSRTGSFRDVLIDTVGLALGVLVVWLIARRRGRRAIG